MEKLDVIYRYMPIVLVVYGVIATVADLIDVKFSANAMAGDTTYEIRMIYWIAIMRSFYSVVFFVGMAAIVAGLNKCNPKGAN